MKNLCKGMKLEHMKRWKCVIGEKWNEWKNDEKHLKGRKWNAWKKDESLEGTKVKWMKKMTTWKLWGWWKKDEVEWMKKRWKRGNDKNGINEQMMKIVEMDKNGLQLDEKYENGGEGTNAEWVRQGWKQMWKGWEKWSEWKNDEKCGKEPFKWNAWKKDENGERMKMEWVKNGWKPMWKCDDENGIDEQIMKIVKKGKESGREGTRMKMVRKGKKWSGWKKDENWEK